jgi:hypothetical protein
MRFTFEFAWFENDTLAKTPVRKRHEGWFQFEKDMLAKVGSGSKTTHLLRFRFGKLNYHSTAP